MRLADPGRAGLAQADDASLKAQLVNWINNYSAYRSSDALGALFRGAVTDARARGIDVTLFVPPLSRCELEAMDQAGSWSAFQRWKEQILAAGPYWDFSGYGKLDRMESLFLDLPHFWPAVGHVMLREFLGQGCGRCGHLADLVREAGARVDTTTIHAHLVRQEAMRTETRSRPDRCTRVVEEMLQAGRKGPGTRDGHRPAPAGR